MLTLDGKKHQFMVVFPVQCLMFVVGIGSGWLPPALSYLHNSIDFKLNDTQSSWVGSLHYAGKIPGSFLAGLLMNKIGRKKVLVLVAFTTLTQWVLLLCGKDVMWIYLSRITFGISAGMHETMMPVYVAENCSPKMRGGFCAATVTFFAAGITASYILSTFLSYNMQAIVNIGQTIIALLTTYLIKETPQYLLMQNRAAKAKERFFWLQGQTGPQSESRFKEIEENVKTEREHFSWRTFSKIPENRKSLRVVLLLQTFIMATGYTGVNSFISRSFEDVSSSSQAHQLTILYGLVQMACVLISAVILDKYNRRTSVLVALAVSFCSHIVCAALQYLNSINIHIPYFPWFILACNSVYASMFMAALMPLFNIIRGELLPLNAKGFGSSLALSSNSIMSFFVAKSFLAMKGLFGIHISFFIYAVACLVAFIYAYFDLPETRGKSLVRIQEQLTN